MIYLFWEETMIIFIRGVALAVLLLPFSLNAQTLSKFDGLAALGTFDDDAVMNLTGRLAYNSDIGVIAGIGLSTDQFLGLDQTLAFKIEGQKRDSRLGLYYNNEKILGQSPTFGMKITHLEAAASQVYDFDSSVTRIEPRLNWELSPSLSFSLYSYYAENEIKNVSITNSALIQADEGRETTTALGFNLDYHFPVRPEGVMRDAHFLFDAEIGTSTSDNDFLSLTTSGQTEHAFNNGNIVLRSHILLGFLGSQLGNTNIGNRKMLGQSSIRGFEFGGFGPRDLAVENTPALGGNYHGIINLDMQFPNAFGGQSERFIPGLLVDMGSLWGLDDINGGVNGSDPVDDSKNFRGSVGVSLQINTRLGEIELYIADPVILEDYDQTQTFGFELNNSF